jgi:parallel beta-helix repeat protein
MAFFFKYHQAKKSYFCNMKKTIFPISLLLVLAFANCQTEHQNLKLKKGLVINSSVIFEKNDTVFITNNDLYEKIITIEGDNLVIDFNGISLIGTENFTKPDEFKGVAIHIKNSKYVTIKNLNVSGFRIALQADSVEYLTIDRCNFSYNYRADSSANFDIEKVKEGAIIINDSKIVDIQNATISNNYNGIVLNNSIITGIGNNEIQFNSKVGIYIKYSAMGEIYKNKIDWNLVAGNWYQNTKKFGTYAANSMTHNGSVETMERWYNSNDFSFSDIDLTTEYKYKESTKSQYENAKIPSLNPKYPKGKAYKLPTKYGVYDFEYPAIFFRTVNENEYVFAMFGPQIGNWKFVNAENIRSTNLKTGSFPATFIIQKEDLEKPFLIEFEFIGTGFYDEFGVWNKKGKVYGFGVEM